MVFDIVVLALVGKKLFEIARGWVLEELEELGGDNSRNYSPCASDTARAMEAELERRRSRDQLARIAELQLAKRSAELQLAKRIVEEELGPYGLGPLVIHLERFMGERSVVIIDGAGWRESFSIPDLGAIPGGFDQFVERERLEEQCRMACRKVVRKYVVAPPDWIPELDA